MSYTATKLVTRAFYLTQIVAKQFQSVSGDQLTSGIELLNELLDIKGSDLRLIPYFTHYEFVPDIGEEVTLIENLLEVETLTFNIGDVRFPSTQLTRKEYFSTARVDHINSLPFSWHQERTLGGTNLYLYFEPGQELTVKIMGKFGLTEVTANTDLSTIYDPYYIAYLRYGLAEYICAEWGIQFPQQAADKLKEIRAKLTDVNPPDLSISKTSTLQQISGLNWGYVNLSPGWTPR